MRRASGFTLFEIMVTLAIVGVMAGFAVPAFQGVLTSSRLSAAAQEISNSASLARNTAIARRRVVVWVPTLSATNPTWTVRLDSATGTEVARHTIDGTVRLAYTPTFTTLVFQPNGYVQRTDASGTAVAADITLQLCDASTRKETGRNVTISRVGRIQAAPHATSATCNPP